MGIFEKTKRRLSFVKLRRTKSEGDVDDSDSSQSNDDQRVDTHSQASSSTQATRVRSILVQNNTEQNNPEQNNPERSPSPSPPPSINSENIREELNKSLTDIDANNQELMLTKEFQARRKHQKRKEEYEDQQAKRRSVITFAPSPARQPRSLEPPTVREQRRFSLPIPNIPFFRRSSKDQSSPIVVGCKVKVLNKKTSLPIPGTVRYVGRPPGADEDWIGIELDSAVGVTDGEYQGVRYFQTNSKCALFVKKSEAERLD